jgi:hypothetical protein
VYTVPMTAERLEEIREVAKMGDWDGEPRASALTKCLRDLLAEYDRLLKEVLRSHQKEVADVS